MKLYATGLLSLTFLFNGWSQTNENFDAGIPGNWTQWSGDGITWTSSANLGVNGTGCAIADFSMSSSAGNSWLQTPFMDLTTMTNPEITLDGAVVRNNFVEPDLSLWYDNGGGWTLINTNWTLTASNDLSPPLDAGNVTWNSLSADLSFLSGNNNIRFSFGADFVNGGWVLVDNVTIQGTGSVPVTSIAVQGQGGASTITTSGGTLQMEETVLPQNATINTVTWSVTNGSGSAIINSTSGLLTAVTNGTVIVRATANDGSGVFGETVITLSNQNVGIGELSNDLDVKLYPNPATHQLNIQSETAIKSISIHSTDGKLVLTQSIHNPFASITVEHLDRGMYYVIINGQTDAVSIPFTLR